MSRALNEQKYNKVKELLEKGFQTSMSDFNPTKQSFYRGDSNINSRRKIANSNSSNDVDLEGGNSSSSKFKSSSSIPIIEGEYSPSESKLSLYSKHNLKSNKSSQLGQHPKERNSTISVTSHTSNSRIQKIIPKGAGGEPQNTDIEDNKSTISSQSRFSKQNRVSKSNFKRVDNSNDLRVSEFNKKEIVSNDIVEEKDVFAQLNNSDSKFSLKAVELLSKNFEEYIKDVPNHLSSIFKSVSSLFSSNNDNAKLNAEELIDKWVNKIKASLLVKHIWSSVSSSTNKTKLMLLEKLNKILPQVAEENPVLLSKHVLPLVYTLLDDKSKYIKKKTEDIVLTLYGLIGSALIEFSPSNKLQMILDII